MWTFVAWFLHTSSTLRMTFLMNVESVLRSKLHPTYYAHECIFTCVNGTLMSPHIRLSGEQFGTILTRVYFLFLRSKMYGYFLSYSWLRLRLGVGLRRFNACWFWFWFYSICRCVHFHLPITDLTTFFQMWCQSMHLFESGSTHVTWERFFSSMFPPMSHQHKFCKKFHVTKFTWKSFGGQWLMFHNDVILHIESSCKFCLTCWVRTRVWFKSSMNWICMFFQTMSRFVCCTTLTAKERLFPSVCSLVDFPCL